MHFSSVQRWTTILPVAALLLLCSISQASVLYEDTFYWRPGGVTEMNPAVPPIDAYVKVQETVFDDTQGRALLQAQLDFNVTHGNGGVIPATPINVYAYSITNLNYVNGPFTNVGAGVTGFNIPNAAGVSYNIYGPNAANAWWHENPGNAGPGNFEWDIDGNNNGNDGDGLGILQGQTFNGFYLVVPDGTTHGFINGAWVHTWTGGGAAEEPGAAQADLVYGTVSGPVPEPATLSAALLGLGALVTRRRRV